MRRGSSNLLKTKSILVFKEQTLTVCITIDTETWVLVLDHVAIPKLKPLKMDKWNTHLRLLAPEAKEKV